MRVIMYVLLVKQIYFNHMFDWEYEIYTKNVKHLVYNFSVCAELIQCLFLCEN